MSYLHIPNLYKDQTVMAFRRCFALEKIHGTSAHVSWRDGAVHYSSGGEKQQRFVALFDDAALRAAFAALGHPQVVVFGEAYGGSQQGQSWRYGKALKFIAFEVKIGDSWLAVSQAAQVVAALGLEFVPYAEVSTDLPALDAERDAPSIQARRNGVEGDVPREGVVLRPPFEVHTNNGERVIAKHKRDEERETATSRKVVDPAALAVLARATEIANEWVTPMRLAHVLDRLGTGGVEIGIERTGDVIKAMVHDVLRESAGEIVDSKEARQAVGKATARLFKARLQAVLRPVVDPTGGVRE